MNAASRIQELMESVIHHPAGVFQANLIRSDHVDVCIAVAALRGTGDEIRAMRDTPEEALQALKELLDRMTCPHCGQRLPKPEAEAWP